MPDYDDLDHPDAGGRAYRYPWPKCKVCGSLIFFGELCDEHAKGNDPFFVADNCGKDLRR